MISVSRKVFYVFICLSFLLAITGVRPAHAAGIVVNTAVDENNTGSDCSLREAITASEGHVAYGGCPAGAGSDTITFASNYTITLNSQLPAVTGTIIINGNGAANTIIQANAAPNTATYRVFENSGDLTLNNLTVRHGRCNGSCATYATEGGGIVNYGTLTVTNSVISNNSASNQGGGIFSNVILAVTNSTITNNSADSGGGIMNNAIMDVTNSTISGNTASNQGGGLFNYSGTVTIIKSTISNNSATSQGGGIMNFSTGTLTLTNSTLSNNSAPLDGGGIYNASSQPLTVTNSTLSGNAADTGGGIHNFEGTLNLINTIIANSTTGGDCFNNSSNGIIGSNSNNLIEATGANACGLTNGSNNNIIGSDPALGSLTGSPAYFPLNVGSLAINAGSNPNCAAPSTNNESQNGVTRPVGSNCDIGSVETLAVIDVTIGAVNRGNYNLAPGSSQRVNYTGLDAGPVVVDATNDVPIIAALRDAYFVNGQLESFVQLMGLPEAQLSAKYYFPAYNNVSLDGQLRFGNVGNDPTTVTVTIAGVVRGTYNLAPGEAKRVNYAGLDAGPVIVESSGGVPIIAALRDAYFVNGKLESFAQLMGLPASRLSDHYYFPAYNNVTLDGQLRIGNVDTISTTVTVSIAGVVRGTYDLDPNEAVRINYAGLDAGPVMVDSSNDASIIAALRDAYYVSGQITSFVQLMGLPLNQLSTKYYFPAYNNVTLDDQLRFGNVGNASTTVTVTIAGVVRGTYNLAPGQAQRVNYAGLDAGPVIVESSGSVPIIAALRDAYFVNGQIESFAQLMGLPDAALSPTYYFPAYNNVTLDGQLRFGVP